MNERYGVALSRELIPVEAMQSTLLIGVIAGLSHDLEMLRGALLEIVKYLVYDNLEKRPLTYSEATVYLEGIGADGQDEYIDETARQMEIDMMIEEL